MDPLQPYQFEFRAGSSRMMGPEARAALQKKISRLNLVTIAVGVPGLLLQLAGRFSGGFLLTIVGGALVITALAFFAQMRGRHPAFCLLGFLSCIGLIILYFLPKRCLACSAEQSYRSGQCDRCGAPLGF